MKNWYQDCKDWLISVGLMEFPTCLKLFCRTEKDGSETWLIIHVNDFLNFGRNDKARKKFELEFGTRFSIEFQGNAH